MPIIGTVGNKSTSVRVQIFLIYLILTIGAATMIYPFMMMLSGSLKSRVDSDSFDVMPKYLFDDAQLFRKYVEARYNENPLLANSCTGAGITTFAELKPPARINRVLVQDWAHFIATSKMPICFYQLGQAESPGAAFMPLLCRKYMEHAASSFNSDLDAYNRAFGSTKKAWFYVTPPGQRYIEKRYTADDSAASKFFLRFKAGQAPIDRIYLSAENMYRYNFLTFKYGVLIEDYNKAHGTSFKSYNDVILSEKAPAGGLERRDWLEFVRENLNIVFIEVEPGALPEYQAVLRAKYGNDISKLNRNYGKQYRSFDEVGLPEVRDMAGSAVVDLGLYVKNGNPDYLRITAPDFRFKKYLSRKYGSISRFNRVAGTFYPSFEAVGIPALESDWTAMRAHKRGVKWEFISRNYIMVISYLLLHGRAMANTAVFCLLSIIIVLTMNPMAAYAMSRYNLPSSYKILLFMMATMAFPSAVTMIPNFLLLKQAHLLNTFWALVLPGMASGYSIFLLKGFFDSLPKDLYEAAMLDGAGEWTMFWRITMSLSKPILAVLALGAFAGAYGSFMYAFTVCQDQSMWTLMVWLYQLQKAANAAVTYAGLIVAAIPTLIVFILSQNVIMRGIIVPQEK